MRIHLAPMEGITDFLVRQLYSRLGGYDQCTTEFIRVTNNIVPDHVLKRYCPELETSGKTLSGTPVYVQILGGNPDAMAETAFAACRIGAPGIDLNFGCPAPTVNSHDGGATILKNPCRVYDITQAVRKKIPAEIPVTVKMRLGFSTPDSAVEIAQAAESAGASRITIHARTRDQAYRPPAHWHWIGKIKLAVKTPLIANGEIWTVEDYKRCVEECGVTDVMLGRGAFVQPLLALNIKELELKPASTQTQCVDKTRFSLIKDFIRLGIELRGDGYALNRTKQWLRQISIRDHSYQPLFDKLKTATTTTEVNSLLA